MIARYPWYEIVEGEELEQGDLLGACPIIFPSPRLSFPIAIKTIPVVVDTFDVVVVTQSCDLANEKISDVILCPHWDLKDIEAVEPALAKKGAAEAIMKGYRPRYAMLSASDAPDIAMGVRIVDFGRIFSLPKVFVWQVAANQGKRLRLCPPYREHLSQAFARFFMRVGLPQDIELPK